jgi:uncharacterized protein
MRVSRAGLAWTGYLVASLLALELVPPMAYPFVVGSAGLLLALVVKPPVGWRRQLVGHDLGRLAGTYAAVVGLFYLAFQVFKVDNVAGLFLSFAGGMLIGVAGPLVHVGIAQRRPLSDLGFTRERLPETLVLAMLLAAVQAALTFPKVTFGTPESWIPLLAMSFAVGLFEAVFFRAYVMAILEPMVGTIGAVAASASLYALYHVGYGMAPAEMVFLFGLGIVYVDAYALVRNLLAIWPLLTPLGAFFVNVRGGEIEMPVIAVLGFLDVLSVMAAAVFLVARWQRRHPASGASPVAAPPGATVS